MKILIKAQAGSHLFGTNTPSSDKDYKGVYLPSKEEILVGDYKESFQHSTGNDGMKNSKDDTDIELYSLKKFLKMVRNGDTAALELMFTPEEMILEKDPMWDELMKYREELLSRKISGIVGYCRQQANKYGIKGSRMGELSQVMTVMKDIEKSLDFKGPKLKHAWEELVEGVKGFEHVHVIELSATTIDGPEVPGLSILGKKFDYHCQFSYVLEILNKMYKNFGQRAREAKKNGGIDWKALSHAARVALQGIELLNTGKITLPLENDNKKLVKDIKCGIMDYSKEVRPLLEELLNELEIAKESSQLREEVTKEFTDKILIEFHRKVIND